MEFVRRQAHGLTQLRTTGIITRRQREKKKAPYPDTLMTPRLSQNPRANHRHEEMSQSNSPSYACLSILKPVEKGFVRRQAFGLTQLRTTGIITRRQTSGQRAPSPTTDARTTSRSLVTASTTMPRANSKQQATGMQQQSKQIQPIICMS